MEAWAHGAPVVAVDTPVARSIVRPGVDGLLTGPDPDGLASAVGALLDDPDRAAAMGGAGRDRVAREFTWAGSAEAFDRLMLA
jgi:glycosyltransferase involved in cell wall biosynthesis